MALYGCQSETRSLHLGTQLAPRLPQRAGVLADLSAQRRRQRRGGDEGIRRFRDRRRRRLDHERLPGEADAGARFVDLFRVLVPRAVEGTLYEEAIVPVV